MGPVPAFPSLPVEILIFAAALAVIAVAHRHALAAALACLAALTLYKLAVTGFRGGTGLAGLADHMAHEWVILANLFLLLTGFALLARHVEESRLPDMMPDFLPDGILGGIALLAAVFVLSAFLDNIAAAIIGGTVARTVFRGKVHIGYLAAIVAASNAGGSGSVVGDTTTTMIWISGVSPLDVLPAYIAALAAFTVFAIPSARAQHRLSPIIKEAPSGIRLSAPRLAIVAVILASAIAANVATNLYWPTLAAHIPAVGLAVWAALLATHPICNADWKSLPETAKGTVFLLALVASASLIPIEALPPASPETTLALGFVSAIFDNIPLTALAINQGGYDWGLLAFAVGFGGSMLWFGSSAGVAIATAFPEARSAAAWLKAGWPIPLAYVAGIAAQLTLRGWHP